jgi:hypothetical protein
VALHYLIDPARRLTTISGEYAVADEWTTLLGAILGDPLWQPGFGILRDLRGATTPVDAATVIRIMEVVKKFWPLLQPTRAAILTPREFDPAVMAAHALADTEGLPMRMFSSLETALEWLAQD